MRIRLPDRRPSELIEFRHDETAYSASISRFDDGGVAEIFLSSGKSGTAIEAVSRDLAVTASIALQFGADLDTLRRALTRHNDGLAAGPLGALLDLLQDKAMT